jgi:hypothetical protein
VLSDVDIRRWDETAAIAELVSRYIRGYGPVTLNDISWWTGFSKARCRLALDSLRDSVTEVEVDGWPGPLHLHRDADVGDIELGSSSVSVLPLLDPYVQGYRDRQRLLAEELHDYVWDGGGNAAPVIVQRGQIIGVWQPVEKPATIRYHLLAQKQTDRGEIEARLQQAGRVYFDEAVEIQQVTKMQPLRDPGRARSAAHPLDDQRYRAR